MKKLLSLALALTMILSLAACGSKPQEPSSTPPVEPAASVEEEPQPVTPAEPPAQPSEPFVDSRAAAIEEKKANYDSLIITAKPDEAMGQGIVEVDNTGTKIYDGIIHVRFKEGTRVIASDSIFVETLAPGGKTYAKITVPSASWTEFTYTFGDDDTFTEPAVSLGDGAIDEAASAKLTEEMTGSFGGGYGGSPTSWFGYIVKMEIFSADTGKYAVATVNTAEKEAVDRIGNTIFGNHAKTFELTAVYVKNESGETLFQRNA